MGLARLLVQGTDVWLNTPRRPLEASGTSGMKAAMNGALNLSILDGWWDEAPRDAAGFGIGDEEEGRSDEEMSAALTTRLENDVVPLFYDREGADRAGMPRGWVDRMAAAATTLGRAFSTDRMLRDYLRWAYLPAAERTRRLTADGARGARELAAWKARVGAAFPKVEFVGVKLSVPEPARLAPGTPFGVEVEIRLGALEASDVAVDWFEGVPDADNVVDAGYSNPLTLVERVDGRAIYGGTVIRPDDDSRGYSVRLRPCHPELTHPNEMGLVLWAG
jgi:starch phosphorylase